jgi:hypothetical protein
MRKLMLLGVLIPQISLAEVFMCTDPDTGTKTFTDRACDARTTGEKVRVEPTNFGGNGYRSPQGEYQKTWRSQQSRAKSGREHSTGYRRNIDNASRTGQGGSAGSAAPR